MIKVYKILWYLRCLGIWITSYWLSMAPIYIFFLLKNALTIIWRDKKSNTNIYRKLSKLLLHTFKRKIHFAIFYILIIHRTNTHAQIHLHVPDKIPLVIINIKILPSIANLFCVSIFSYYSHKIVFSHTRIKVAGQNANRTLKAVVVRRQRQVATWGTTIEHLRDTQTLTTKIEKLLLATFSFFILWRQ